MRTRTLLVSLALLSMLLLLSACGDTNEPALTPSGDAGFQGNFDASGGSFLLSRIDQPGVVPLRIDLIGSNLKVDPATSTLSIDVEVVNRGRLPLYPQALIWVSQFNPISVSVLNPDIVPPAVGPMDPNFFGFDYSQLLGDDGVLAPGEHSQPHIWIFSDPEMQSFSFFARAEFAPENPTGGISGRVFMDANRDGIPQPDEGPFPGSVVMVTTPSGDHLRAMPDSMGVYRVPAREAGLYELRLDIMLDCIWCITTPNPLQVILSTTPDGSPRSFDHADFGAVLGPCSPPPIPQVVMFGGAPGDLQPQDWYRLLDSRLMGTELRLHVGFSGCSPDHPFQLFAGLPAPDPGLPEIPQTWLRLTHDSHGELCEAWFERDLVYDLQPILDAFGMGPDGSGMIHLTLEDPTGQVVEFELGGWLR